MSDEIIITAPAGSYARGDKAQRVIGLLLEGASYRRIRRETGVSTVTIAKYKRGLADQGVVTDCACGKLSGHRGWCKPLFDASPARQAAVSKMLGRGLPKNLP